MKKIFFIASILFTTVFFFTACNKKDQAATTVPTFDAFLQSQPTLSTFAKALDKAQLQSFITGPGPFTWYAPNDAAFAASGLSVDAMTPSQLNYILLYHMSPALVTSKDMIAQNSFARSTQIGSTAALSVFLGQLNDSFYINGSNIVSVDNMVSNGAVHIINRVNVPPNLRGNLQSILNTTGQHSLFIAALTKAVKAGATTSEWAALGTSSVFTVLAPTDDAMTAAGFTAASINAASATLLDSVVRYHIFSGSRLFTNDFGNHPTPATFLAPSKVLLASGNGTKIKGTLNATPVDIVIPNLLGTNGVVHVINGVLKY